MFKTSLLLLIAVLFLFSACADKASTAPSDKEGPTLTLDTIKAKNFSSRDTNNFSLVTDSLYLSGTVSDPSGVDKVEIQVGGTVYPCQPSGTTWKSLVPVYLKSGINSVNVVAEDEENNATTLTRTIAYITNYFPLTGTSAWIFKGSIAGDTISIRSDSVATLDTNIYYRLSFVNAFQGVSDTLFTYNYSGIYVVDSTLSGVARSQEALFYREYTPTTPSYNSMTVRFLGDTTLGSIVYRNCIELTPSATQQIAQITAFILAPNQGIIAVKASLKVYPLFSWHR